jgi:nitrite reductase/ring-hydroxylating ferredoxin subunit
MSEHDPGCAGCGRRDFLREAALLAGTLLLSAGATAAQASRLEVAVTRAAGRTPGRVTYPVPAADGVHVDRENEVILVRHQGRVFAFALSCPHQRTMLRWDEGNGRFQCPKHRSRYSPDGTFVSGRATRGMDRYPVRLQEGGVVVELDAVIRQDQDRAAWDAAFATL